MLDKQGLTYNGLAKRAVSALVIWNPQLTADETLVFGRHRDCSVPELFPKKDLSFSNTPTVFPHPNTEAF
jgi:hypothetical protein